MDLGDFFKGIGVDYKTMLLSVILCFPMAYIDCWVLSVGFCDIELMKQVILVAGIAVILVVGWVFYNEAYLSISGAENRNNKLDVVIIIAPAVCATAICTIWRVGVVTLPFIAIFFLYAIATILMAVKNHNGKESQDKADVEQNQ